MDRRVDGNTVIEEKRGIRYKKIDADTIQVEKIIQVIKISELKKQRDQFKFGIASLVTDKDLLLIAKGEAEQLKFEQEEEQLRTQERIRELDKEIKKFEELKIETVRREIGQIIH